MKASVWSIRTVLYLYLCSTTFLSSNENKDLRDKCWIKNDKLQKLDNKSLWKGGPFKDREIWGFKIYKLENRGNIIWLKENDFLISLDDCPFSKMFLNGLGPVDGYSPEETNKYVFLLTYPDKAKEHIKFIELIREGKKLTLYLR